MAYTKTSLISSPIESPFGISEALGFDYDLAAGVGASVLNLFGQKEQTKQERAKRDAAAAQAAATGKGGGDASGGSGGKIPATYLVVGGLAVAGLLVFAMRRK